MLGGGPSIQDQTVTGLPLSVPSIAAVNGRLGQDEAETQ